MLQFALNMSTKIIILLVLAVIVCVNAQGQHPGSCPRRPPIALPCRLDRRCQSDSECPSDQKCCNTGCAVTCIRPRDVTKLPSSRSTVKPQGAGRCPVLTDPPCGYRCRSDADCPNPRSEKCCEHECGRECLRVY